MVGAIKKSIIMPTQRRSKFDLLFYSALPIIRKVLTVVYYTYSEYGHIWKSLPGNMFCREPTKTNPSHCETVVTSEQHLFITPSPFRRYAEEKTVVTACHRVTEHRYVFLVE